MSKTTMGNTVEWTVPLIFIFCLMLMFIQLSTAEYCTSYCNTTGQLVEGFDCKPHYCCGIPHRKYCCRDYFDKSNLSAITSCGITEVAPERVEGPSSAVIWIQNHLWKVVIGVLGVALLVALVVTLYFYIIKEEWGSSSKTKYASTHNSEPSEDVAVSALALHPRVKKTIDTSLRRPPSKNQVQPYPP
ncbi:unnamed protein product [Owenia fusiformis]|uniref:Shisa N-terminal domain-containing protein n=1 Tax=Owenia fusiformis TaxID=6347 RepID=A0A8J1XFT5_OWEFU|nr:unnamed protein product [Owenia fusiformis]